MRIALALTIATLTVAAGCSTTNQIVPAGKNTYVLRTGNDTCDCTEPVVWATQQATEYCAKQSKPMLAKDTKVDTFDRGYGQRITLTFSCAAEK